MTPTRAVDSGLQIKDATDATAARDRPVLAAFTIAVKSNLRTHSSPQHCEMRSSHSWKAVFVIEYRLVIESDWSVVSFSSLCSFLEASA